MSGPDDKVGADDMDSRLRQGFQVEPLSAAAMARIRAATQQEWRQATVQVARPRRWLRHASAAVITLVVIGSGLMLAGRLTLSNAAVVGTLERADDPGAIEHRWLRDRALANGDTLHAGQRVELRGGARIALAGAGSLRVAAGTRVAILSAHALGLLDGSLYLDIPPTPGARFDFSVQTPAGTFTHVGTQFQLAVHGGQTLLQVREGSVRWHSGSGDVLAESGTQLTISPDGKVTREQVAAMGANWSWAEGLAGSFAIENRSLADFLHHFARETGRTLVFSSAAIENRAATTLLHGSIDELAPADALANVMATTSLRFTLAGNSIRIESAGDSGQTSK